jgi:protease-4
LERLLDDEFALLVDSLAVARGMTPDSVRALLDRGPFTSLEALGAGWVDTLLYDDEVDSLAVRAAGARRETRSLQRYLARHRASPTAPRLALVLASGTIAPGRSRGSALFGDVLGAETLAGALREARRRSSVKAIVLRVDSPGGDALASDVVWHEVERCRAVKPVVVSMSDLAASGGYYVGMGADAVVAQPATLTGSIGIYGGKFNQLGLYRKLGFNVETLARGRRAEMLSPFRDFTEDERKVFQRELEAYYQQFVAKVAKGRHLAEAAADSAAGGRVWSGVSARALGLVDTLGGLPLALRLAQQKAGISPTAEVQVAVYPRDERTFLERLLSDLLTDDSEEAETAAALTAPLRDLLRVAALPQGRPWALLPWVIEIR